jgi:hypothetical protein
LNNPYKLVDPSGLESEEVDQAFAHLGELADEAEAIRQAEEDAAREEARKRQQEQQASQENSQQGEAPQQQQITPTNIDNVTLPEGPSGSGQQTTNPTRNVLSEADQGTPPPPKGAHPVNFRQVGSGQDVGGGVLQFRYDWDSSTGNKADLKACTIGEYVTWSGGTVGKPFVMPLPYMSPKNNKHRIAQDNPIVLNVKDPTAAARDDHQIPGAIVKPFRTSTVTTTQYYRFKCPGYNNGNWVNVMGPITITRTIRRNANGTWQYTITKSGASATLNLGR